MNEDEKNALSAALGVSFPRINYLVHIDDQRRIAYVETPKVACTSIKKFMQDTYIDGEWRLPNPSMVHERSHSPLGQLSTITAEQSAQVLWGSDYRRFSFVRNPYTRLLSGYLDKLVTNEFERARHLPLMGFELGSHPTLLEFLERLAQQTDAQRDIHFTTQASLLRADRVEYDYIGRFEVFKQDFLRLQATYFGVNHPTKSYESFGKHHASNASSKIDQYFGPLEIELTREIYENDFLLFGYSEDVMRSSDRQPHVKVHALSEMALSVGLSDNKVSIDQLPSRLSNYLSAYDQISRFLDNRPRLHSAAVGRAFQRLSENGNAETILDLDSRYPGCAEQMPLVANQVVKALVNRGDLDMAISSLYKFRELHPNDLGLLLQGVRLGLEAGKPNEAAALFEQICSARSLPRWAHRPLMNYYMAYFHYSREKGERLVERIFCDEDFMCDPDQKWAAADYFLANLTLNKPVDHTLLGQVRDALKASSLEDNSKSIISCFMLQGRDFNFTPERSTLLADLLGNGSRTTLIRVLGWRMHPLSNVSFNNDEAALLDEIAMRQQALGNIDMVCMIKAVRGANISRLLIGRNVALGRKKSNLQRRPKLALCISGQLRNFRRCFAQWRNSPLFEAAEITVFVSTWSRIGQKFPIPAHADRTFNGNFLNAYIERWHSIGGQTALLRDYPNFSRLLENNEQVSIEDISAVYTTNAVEVFNEDDPQFEGFNNQEKMFFQIANAFKMATGDGKDFDLCMRLRPDIEAFVPKGLTWEEVLAIAYEEGKLFTDRSFKVNNPHGLFVGDQFAVGQMEIMAHYSALFSDLRAVDAEKKQTITMDGGPKPHSTLAFHLAAGGISPIQIVDRQPALIDPKPLLPENIMDALSKDLRERHRNIDPLWLAIQKDLNGSR